jgi:ATP-binding cassette subfamily F protein 3
LTTPQTATTVKAKTRSKKKQVDLNNSIHPDSNIDTTVEPEIVAYSQQSRFHRETFDASNIDIDIKGVNVSVDDKELLVDAHLRLKPGVRYGMVGQNGVGKSGSFRVIFW